MAAITYTAQSRAPLITTTSPVHADGESYSIDVKLQAFNAQIEIPKSVHVAIAGNSETVLTRSVKIYSATFIWPDTLHPEMEEFLFSIASGEPFELDPFGSVSSADSPIVVKSVDSSYNYGRMTSGSTPWRSVSMILRQGS
jgi:hypothetical protein